MTTAYADIHIKVNKDVKAESEKILNSIGLSISDLINMTLRRVIYERRIPFSTRVEIDAAPEDIRINLREEIVEMLERLVRDDAGTRLSEDEVWSRLE